MTISNTNIPSSSPDLNTFGTDDDALYYAAIDPDHNQGCPMGYPYGSVKIFPRSKLHIRMQIKIMQNLAIH